MVSGAISKLYDKLPAWAKLIFVALTIVGFVYCRSPVWFA